MNSQYRLSLLLVINFILSILFFPIASQLQFGKLQVVPKEALYTSIQLFPSYEMTMLAYGILSILNVILYAWIFFTLYAIYKNKNLHLSQIQKILIGLILVSSTFTPPFSSNDFYYYLGLGRIQAFQNVNPYLVPISQAPIPDVVASIGVWVDIPTMYAPFLTYFFKIVTSFSEDLLIEGFLLKSLTLIAFLTSGYFTFKIGEIYRSDLGAIASLSFLLNPLSIHEILVNGHNDIFVITVFLGAVYLALKSHYTFSCALFFVAVFIKFPFLGLAPLFLFLPQSFQRNETEFQTPSQKIFLWFKIVFYNGLRYMLLGFLIVVPFLIFFYNAYFQDKSAFKAFGILATLWSNSTPGIIAVILKEVVHVSTGKVIALAALIRFGFFPFVFYRAFKIKNEKTFLEEIAFVLLLFYLVFSAYVWPWYWIIIIPFLFFRPSRTYLFYTLGLAFGFIGFWIFFHLNANSPERSLLQVKLIEYILSYTILLLLILVPYFDKRLHRFINEDV